MKFLYFKLALLGLITLSLTSCKFDINTNGNAFNSIEGKGPVIEKTIALNKPFDKVSTHSAWEVELIKSEQPHLVVKTQKNILPLFEYSINNGELSISFKDAINVSNVEVQKVKVYYTHLSKIDAASASSITSDKVFEQESISISASSAADINLKLKTKNCSADASSAADIHLSGTSINFYAEASSAANIEALDLKTKNSTAKASSAGNITVNALNKLEAKTSSGGDIAYAGHPKKLYIDQSISGDDIEPVN